MAEFKDGIPILIHLFEVDKYRFCKERKTAYLCSVIGEFVEGMTTLIAQAVPSPKV